MEEEIDIFRNIYCTHTQMMKTPQSASKKRKALLRIALVIQARTMMTVIPL